MHKHAKHDCLTAVLTAQEAATLWGLSRNTISDACRRGALRGRKSGQTWLVTIADMMAYQKRPYRLDRIPKMLKPAFEEAILLQKYE